MSVDILVPPGGSGRFSVFPLSGETVAIVTAPEFILDLSDKELICGSIVYMINTIVAILIIRIKFKLVYINIYCDCE